MTTVDRKATTLVFDVPAWPGGSSSPWSPPTSVLAAPIEVHAVFGRDRRGRTTGQPFATRVFCPGTEVKMDFRYKHRRVKQSSTKGGRFDRDRHQ